VRPWLLFGLGLLGAAAGLGWMSATLLRLEERALLSENSRLALWRMDLALARLISTESARPTSDYAPHAPALAKGPPAGVRVHFDVSPEGKLSSPEDTEDGDLDHLAELSPQLLAAGQPAPVANADGTRNGAEFNRRNLLVMNNNAPPAHESQEAAMAPAWYGNELVLARRVRLADGVHLQGAWLDWPSLRESLLRDVKDLVPEAQLEPVKGPPRSDALMLASLPVRLVPGIPARVVDPERASIVWVIGGAWLALVLVAVALGVLLLGTLALDERRAAFVSAVTHELRTPLTTFKLYAEMLEEDMVPEQKRQEYLRTLSQEANRLGYLVENVLAYAQIEKWRTSKPLEVLRASDLLERIVPRLVGRAQSALKVEPIPDITVKADRVSVEQILFNLVDNACKYSRPLGCTLSFAVTDDRLSIVVSDEGPGVSPEVERKLFEPLRKSAAQAADSARGIGLGLALSRRLAGAMGGDLRYRKVRGATFELSLVRVTRA
jgi:signal transduction histidine kinase